MMTVHYPSRFFSPFLLFVIMLWLSSCNQQTTQQNKGDNEVIKEFSQDDMATIYQLVGYFDSLVQSATPNINELDSAYKVYLDSVCPLILKNGDMGLSGIDIKERNKLLDSFDRKALSQIFNIGDTLKYFSLSEKQRVKKYYPHYVTINRYGAYYSLLQKLSTENDFIQAYYQQVREFGDLTPTCYGMMLRDYRQLDFSDPMQRLIFIVNVLHTNEEITDMFKH